jgi:hypothetical protein
MIPPENGVARLQRSHSRAHFVEASISFATNYQRFTGAPSVKHEAFRHDLPLTRRSSAHTRDYGHKEMNNFKAISGTMLMSTGRFLLHLSESTRFKPFEIKD